MSRRATSYARLIVGGAALAAGALAPAAAAPSQEPDPLFDGMPTLERRAANAIGRDYACTVVTAAPGDPRRALRVYVTDRDAIGKARRVSRRLGLPRATQVRVTSKRFRRRTMRKIEDRAIASRPADAQEIRFGEKDGTPYYARCPKLRLMILPEGEASQAAEDWARGLEERYGSDRIAVVRGRTTLRPGR
jgi:hypothetical protein